MNKYQTQSLWEAAALFSLGHTCHAEIIGNLADGRAKYLYIFDTENEAEATNLENRVDQINHETLNINLSAFKKSWNVLKNLKPYKQ